MLRATLALALAVAACGPTKPEYWIAPGASEAMLVLSDHPPNPF